MTLMTYRDLPGGSRSAYSRLRALSGHWKDAAPGEIFFDRAEKLSWSRRLGWAKFLSSIATTESIEGMLIGPLREVFAGETEVQEYLAGHARDEQRHFEAFRGYAKGSFGFEKKKRSLSDRVVYDTLLPWVAAFAKRRPICALAMLRFYEAFSVDFYRMLKRLAERDSLPGLLSMIRSIEKDELRHLAGLEELMRRLQGRGRGATFFDRLMIRSVLFVLLIDIDLRPWALHNRDVRRNALAIGIDPDEMNAQAAGAVRSSLGFCR